MTEFTLLVLIRETFNLALQLAIPILTIGTAVGVLVSILQTATSIQEQSLSFIPKLLAVVISLILLGPWMLNKMMEFTVRVLGALHTFAR